MAEIAEFWHFKKQQSESFFSWAQYDQSTSFKEKGAGVVARLGINRKLLQVCKRR